MSDIELIDSHCHLIFENFESDIEDVVQRLRSKGVRKLVHAFQLKCAYNPPKKYKGSVLDGRDITSVILKDAMFKFFITANVFIRQIYKNRIYKVIYGHKTLKHKRVMSKGLYF